MRKRIKHILLDADYFVINGYEGVLFEGTQKELIEECEYSFHMQWFYVDCKRSEVIDDRYYVYLG